MPAPGVRRSRSASAPDTKWCCGGAIRAMPARWRRPAAISAICLKLRCRRNSRSRPDSRPPFPPPNLCWWRRRRRRSATCWSGSLPCKKPVVWLCKGFAPQSAELPHQIAARILPVGSACGALSGPSFALEVARGLPTALTLASADAGFSQATARALHGPRLRVYFSSDIAGVEVGGAVKNVMAIATGIADGLGLGGNARAALITRGLAEITRLGVKLGGRPGDFHRSHRRRRSDPDLYRRAVAQPARRPRPRARQEAGGHPARTGACGRGCIYRGGRGKARFAAGHRHADHAGSVRRPVRRGCAARSGGAIARA